jgi:RNA polymerase sigma factor (sigma-70 family)
MDCRQSNQPPPPYSLMWSPSDDALLAGLGAGDEDAARAFVRRFQHRVYGLALGIVGDGTAAQDVAQEAFVRAWRFASAYDARRGPVVTWLLAITRNAAIDTLRMRRPEPIDPDSIVALQLASSEPHPDAVAVLSEETARLREALAGLPVEQRRAVLLASYMGRTAREVGEIEHIPLGTAKTRIRTGLLRLHAELAREREAW